MKKIIFSLIASAAILSACDPSTDSKEWSGHKTESFTIQTKQYDLNADGTYTEAAEGNYIEFFTSPSTIVDVYYITSKGVEFSLAKGKPSGMLELKPARGSEPLQTIYFKSREMDGSSVTMETKVTVKVATDLSPEVKLLASNSGTKKWKWMPTEVNGGACWGNAGYGAGAQAGDGTINGAWWGCGPVDLNCPNTFADQLQHSAEGKLTGEEYSTSCMEFNENGTIDKYDLDGNKIGSGTFSVDGYSNGDPIDGKMNVGYLNTSAGAILWPYSINTGGGQPERYEIAYLSVDRMILIWAAAGTGDWAECTWWSFASDDDIAGCLTSTKWGWEPTAVNGGASWGNAGYGAGAQAGDDNINGAWWGCGPVDLNCANTFADQLQHSAVGALTGEEYSTSYMEFTEDGLVNKYDLDGAKLNKTDKTWSITKGATHAGIATLNTAEGAILWPYSINTGGGQPTAFEVGYASSKKLVLIWAAEGTGDWAECTWWSFGAK